MNIIASLEPVVLLFSATPQVVHLEGALADAGLATMHVGSMDSARQILTAHRGTAIAVLDTSPHAPYSVDSVYRLLHQSPPVPTLLLFPAEGRSSLRTENVSAVDDYAYLNDPVEELVRRAQVLSRRMALTAPGTAAQPGQAAGPARFHRGQTVVVYAPKGGVGKSTIAVNLAVALTRLFNKEVALVDADLWFGNASVLLDVRNPQSMASLVAAETDLDTETVQRALVAHPSGIHMLRAPTTLTEVDEIREYLPARLAALCTAMFDFVIVDGQPGLDEYMLQILEGASRIVLVVTPELAVLNSAIRVLEVAPSLGWADKLLLVLNRADSGVPPREVEATLGRPIDVSITTAWRQMIDAGNYGEPIMVTDPGGREQVTRDLARLAARLAGEPEPRWGSSLWRRVLGQLGRRPAPAAKSAAPALPTSPEPALASWPEHALSPNGHQPTNGHHGDADGLHGHGNGRRPGPDTTDEYTAAGAQQAKNAAQRNGAAGTAIADGRPQARLMKTLIRTPRTGQEGGASAT